MTLPVAVAAGQHFDLAAGGDADQRGFPLPSLRSKLPDECRRRESAGFDVGADADADVLARFAHLGLLGA